MEKQIPTYLQLADSLDVLWQESVKAPKNFRNCLVLFCGLLERLVGQPETEYTMSFLLEQLELLKSGNMDPLMFENLARSRALPVCRTTEDAVSIQFYFGHVESVSGGIARVLILDDDGLSLLEDEDVLLSMLPVMYRSEGAGVVWVERTYRSETKGRFEPGSTRHG